MRKQVEPLLLNLGCGFDKREGWVNADAYEVCNPDLLLDLNKVPLPWKDNSVDEIYCSHVLEHVEDWWPTFVEFSRILKLGGILEIRVPDESSRTAITYRDHFHVFSLASFHGVHDATHGSSAWAKTEEKTIPLKLESYYQVPYVQYEWMTRFGFKWVLKFCSNHLRNFIHEQRFLFRKIGQ